jgi:peptidoglycan/xylan/chitin deacetylase (PgdA/CDA1 family)
MIKNPVPWPNGARCAVAFTLDMDADSILHLAHPDRAHQMVATLSMLRYGPLVAIPRILETWRKFDLKQSFFIPAWCIESYPGVVEAILRDGHEIGHHGYIHEHPNELSRDEELYWLQRGIEVIVKHTGQRPRGWRAPLYNFSNHAAAPGRLSLRRLADGRRCSLSAALQSRRARRASLALGLG